MVSVVAACGTCLMNTGTAVLGSSYCQRVASLQRVVLRLSGVHDNGGLCLFVLGCIRHAAREQGQVYVVR